MTRPGAGSGKEPAHPAEAAIPFAACTIVSKNYLSLARVWDASFRKHHPEAKTFVLLVDRIEGAFDPAAEPFETIPVEDLGIPGFRQLAFRYNILELNTAVKPFFLEHLLEVRGVEQLLYFDPDILVLAPLEHAREALAAHPIALVPHITSPIPPDGRHPSEQDFLLSGAYNFGFLALRESRLARQFLSWWKARVVEGAFIAPERGLFTDQKWGDLVPSLFPDAAIIGDRGYNVAYWNLQERMDVTKTPEGLRVGEVPLAFFHFSGLDFDRPEEISKHQDRYRLADLSTHYHALFREYLAMLHLAGFEKTRRWRYGFGYFDDGVAIPDFVRRLYHAEAKRAECWPDPFSSRPDGFREWILEPDLPGSPLPRLLLAIHRERADLHNAFPDRERSGARGLLRWAIESSPAEYGLGDFFTERFRRILEAIGPAELLSETAIVGSGPRPERLHLLAIGDVSGPETYHVGDEAMLAGNLSALRRQLSNVTFTVVSRDPQWTGAHYGTRAIAPIGFPDRMKASARERQGRLDEVLGTLATWQDTGTLAAGAAGADALRELSRADALLISGGGNLNATWPEYLYERAALIRMAHAMDRPVVVLGQTLGPHLEPDERDLLASTLPLARLVGVRERPSADLALSLGVDPSRLILQTDDAFFLDGRAVRDPGIAAELVRDARPWIVVTIHRFVPAGDGPPLESIARQLSELSRATGCRLVFVPHVAAPQDRAGESDAAFARELAARMPAAESPLLLDVLLAEEVAWLTRQAALVVSSRYHPVVFALSGGNPALGLYTDDYTRVKIEGALAHAGLERWAIPMPRALEGGLAEVGARLWTDRDAVRRSIAVRESGWKEQEEVRWRRIAETISGGEAAVISAQPNRKESGVADRR